MHPEDAVNLLIKKGQGSNVGPQMPFFEAEIMLDLNSGVSTLHLTGNFNGYNTRTYFEEIETQNWELLFHRLCDSSNSFTSLDGKQVSYIKWVLDIHNLYHINVR